MEFGLALIGKFKFSSLPCLVGKGYRGKECNTVIHEAHILNGSYSGANLKSDITVPLCAIHHSTQHAMGELTFWDDIELAKECGIGLREAKTKGEALMAIARYKRQS
jgi:hypothetical protein